TILETHNASQKSDPQRAENDATVIRVLEKSAVDTSPLVNKYGYSEHKNVYPLIAAALTKTYRYDCPCGAGKSCRIQPFFVAVSKNLPNVGLCASEVTFNSDGATATAFTPSWSRRVLMSIPSGRFQG